MNRRAFLTALAAGLAAAADPERLLWIPGKKHIFIPPPALPLQLEMPFDHFFMNYIKPALEQIELEMAASINRWIRANSLL